MSARFVTIGGAGLGAHMMFGKRERLIRRIIVVEDEPLVAFENEYLLGEAGYEVIATVDSFSEARRYLEEQDVHLVLTDIKLRGEGDGTDVARAAARKSVPVLFVSAFCPLEARELGMGCLSKPYTDRGLLAALDALDARLSGRRMKRLPEGLEFYAAG